ncbi:hypothetical protein LCGC14_0395330 [marine sediment metagenome]|uniref:ParB-like N-terminal domain-containing protein n=1 Tax=marine sediment metagenome TaxID=412755 RepID=A0A0F9W7F1_9ZZZZ
MQEKQRNLLDIKAILKEIDISSINPGQRGRKKMRNIKEMEISIKERGLIHPIAVMSYKERYKGYNYFLLAGGRRIQALKNLKETKIQARIYPPDLNSFEITSIELEENLKREALTDGERLTMVKKVHDHWEDMYGKKTSTSPTATGHSKANTAERLGVSKAKITEDLKLAEYIEAVPELKEMDRKEIVKTIKTMKKTLATKEKVAEIKKEREEIGKVDKLLPLEQSFITGNFYEKAREIPNGTIDLIDLDIDYPIEVDDNIQHANIQGEKERGVYQGISKKEYPKMMKLAMRESYRMMNNTGWCIIWFGREYFKEIQTWGEEIGFKTCWYTGRWLKGAKHGHTRNPQWFLNHTIEEFFYFRKSSSIIDTPHVDIFEHPPTPPSIKQHPFEKPVNLMYEILQTFIHPGSRVVVPFAGSGNTLKACWQYGCKGVGFELGEEYKERFIVDIRSMFT